MVRAVPGLPDAAGRARRPAARFDGGGRPPRVHPRRPGRDRRRLPRGPAGGPAADRAAHRRGPPGDRAVADPDGRVPRLGRDDDPEPRDRLARRRGIRRGDARRLPAGHVRPRRPDAADPPSGRDPARRRLARRPRRDRPPRLHLARARRLVRPDRVPRRRLRQRGVPAGHPREARREGRPLRRGEPRLLRRPVDPRDVRHRPRRAVAGASPRSWRTPTPPARTSSSGSRR